MKAFYDFVEVASVDGSEITRTTRYEPEPPIEPVPGYFERLKARRVGRGPVTAEQADAWLAAFGYRSPVYAQTPVPPAPRVLSIEERQGPTQARLIRYAESIPISHRSGPYGVAAMHLGIPADQLRVVKNGAKVSDALLERINTALDRLGVPK